MKPILSSNYIVLPMANGHANQFKVGHTESRNKDSPDLRMTLSNYRKIVPKMPTSHL